MAGLRSKQWRDKRAKIIKRRAILYVSFVGLMLVFFAITLRLNFLTINNIHVDQDIGMSEQIRESAQKWIAGSYFFIIPKRSIFFIQSSSLVENILHEFPHILSANVDISSQHNILNIRAQERKKNILWCREDAILNNRECFFADTQGLIFSKAPVFSGTVLFTYIGGQSASSTDPIGTLILPLQEFTNLNNFLNAIKDIGLEINEINISKAHYELLINQSTDLFLNPSTLAQQPVNIKAAIASGDLILTNEFLRNIEYIDLRYENKIYLKKRE